MGTEVIARRQRSDLVTVEPFADRKMFRAGQIVTDILLRARLPVVSVAQGQVAAATNLWVARFEVVAQEPGYKGTPMTLLAYKSYRQDEKEYYLAGFDAIEGRRGHFFCQIPNAKDGYGSVNEALEALKPEAVTSAEALLRTTKRQGDLFAIPMLDFDPTGDPHFATYGPRVDHWVMDTNHYATEAVVVDGTTYARGWLRHDPTGRRPDHKPLRLGKTWHLIAKNRVPVEAPNPRKDR